LGLITDRFSHGRQHADVNLPNNIISEEQREKRKNGKKKLAVPGKIAKNHVLMSDQTNYAAPLRCRGKF
jgi:hypothetical protein